MKKRIVGLYRKVKGAEKAVDSLVDANFNENKINVITNEAKIRNFFYKNIDHENVNQNAAMGSVIGGVVGGVGTLLGVFLTSGIAPLVGVITVFVGTGIGRTTGCVLGALKTLEIPEEATLVTLQTNEARVEEVMDIMTDYNPIDIECAPVK